MIPLVGTLKELEHQAAIVRRVADEVIQRERVKFNYLVGTMIEGPRAALVADQIAKAADFFSFGTNDLTQTTFGFSRDDAGKFIPRYMELGILERDAFEVLDQQGVGELIRIGVEKGRKAKPDLKVGICGEHGGEPRSVEFCHRVGMDYVSCSPYRVPLCAVMIAPSPTFRWPAIPTCPPSLTPRPRWDDPASPTCAARTAFSPTAEPCPI